MNQSFFNFSINNSTGNEILVMYETNLKTISILDEFTKIKEFCIMNNNLTIINGLEKMTNLEELSIHENYIKSITGLETLTKLKN